MKKVLIGFLFLVGMFLCVAFISCAGGAGGNGDGADGASLSVTLPQTGARSLQYLSSEIISFTASIESDSYSSGPKSAGPGETIIFSCIPEGTYMVTACGKTASGGVAAMGNETVTVTAGQSSSATVTLARLYHHTVNFYDGSTQLCTSEITDGYTVSAPADPSDSNKELIGWFTSSDGGTTLSDTAYNFDSPVTEDTTLYAKWLYINFEGTLEAFSSAEFKSGSTEDSPYDITITNVTTSGSEGTRLSDLKTVLKNKGVYVNLTLVYNSGLTKISGLDSINNLVSIVIPEGPTEIGNYAFSSSSKLKSVTIPASVNRIGGSVFSGTSKLETLNISGTNLWQKCDIYGDDDALNFVIELPGIKSYNTNYYFLRM